MGVERSFVSRVHNATARDYLGRMVDNKPYCMSVAKQYGQEFWDGDRRFGYGGYVYDGRWRSVAEEIVATYGLTDESRVLDVGCGKAHLIYELKKLLPRIQICGFDISEYALRQAPEEIREFLQVHAAQDPYEFDANHFDLVLSLATLHNLKVYDLETSLLEIERVGRNAYVMVEAYRNESEMFNLECWALTMESLFHRSEWLWLYDRFGYSGDYEFIYFE